MVGDMVSFEQARQAVSAEWPDYDIAPYGYETDDSWLILLLPETAGGRVAAVSKDDSAIRWINETAAEYTQQRPVGSRPDDDPTLDEILAMAAEDDRTQLDHDELRLRGIVTERAAGHDVTPGHDDLHHWWVWGEGRARWKTWTDLFTQLAKIPAVGPLKARVFASKWFLERYHYAAGSDINRVKHGKPPRGKRVGPG